MVEFFELNLCAIPFKIIKKQSNAKCSLHLSVYNIVSYSRCCCIRKFVAPLINQRYHLVTLLWGFLLLPLYFRTLTYTRLEKFCRKRSKINIQL